ncbi:MAG: ROK family protein [Fimbriimonadaceae bacterium]
MKCVIGVDLGGTNVRAQAVTEDGELVGDRFENPSNAQSGIEPVVQACALTIGQVAASCNYEIGAVGMAVPGHIDDKAGLVKWAPNFGQMVDNVFRYWVDVPLKRPLEERTGLKIVLGNDANAAALGEYKFGTGKNSAKCLVMLTLGTGIGGGVVFSPEAMFGNATGPLLMLGGNLGGGELGHTLLQMNGLDSTGGAYGSLEAYCQRDAIIRRAQHRINRGRKSLINDLVEGDWSKITPKTISEAAEKGDGLAIEVWREFGQFLGMASGSLINIFAPDILAIGGQVSNASDWFMPYLIDEARNIAAPTIFRDCDIKIAEQVENAGILGGAAMAIESIR